MIRNPDAHRIPAIIPDDAPKVGALIADHLIVGGACISRASVEPHGRNVVIKSNITRKLHRLIDHPAHALCDPVVLRMLKHLSYEVDHQWSGCIATKHGYRLSGFLIFHRERLKQTCVMMLYIF